MIEVTRLNHTSVVINSDLIEQIESTPDTVVTLTTGQKIMVLETKDAIVKRVLGFRRSIIAGDSASGQGSAVLGQHTLADRSNGRL